MTTGRPIIKAFSTKERFGYLWLKYVTGFNLDVHCAKCLVGEYSDYFSFGQRTKILHDAVLNEHPARYYYICGVTAPYRWRDNLHIAFEYCEDSFVEYNDGRTYVLIENAKRIDIKRKDFYDILHGHEKAYFTCRNWQFAYQMTHKEGNT